MQINLHGRQQASERRYIMNAPNQPVTSESGIRSESIEISPASISVKYPLRHDVGDLTRLEASIRHFGLIHPILIDKQNVLLAGHRRLQACRNIGLPYVAALRIDIEARSLEAIALQSEENTCRQNLTEDEVAQLEKAKSEAELSMEKKGILSSLRKLLSYGN